MGEECRVVLGVVGNVGLIDDPFATVLVLRVDDIGYDSADVGEMPGSDFELVAIMFHGSIDLYIPTGLSRDGPIVDFI